MTRTGRRRGAIATAALASAALALTGCGSGDDSGDGGDTADVDIDAVLEEGGELTVWAWDPTLETVAENFQEEYPNVDIELVNAGTGNDQRSEERRVGKEGRPGESSLGGNRTG